MNKTTKAKLKKEIKMKKCRYCSSTEKLTLDHRHPKILGGTDERKNLQVLCESCNKLKAGIPDKIFRRIMTHGVKIGWGTKDKESLLYDTD